MRVYKKERPSARLLFNVDPEAIYFLRPPLFATRMQKKTVFIERFPIKLNIIIQQKLTLQFSAVVKLM